MNADWIVKEDGYHRVTLYVDSETKRVLGEVNGSTYTGEWYALTGVPESKNLGRYITEKAAQDAVVRAVLLDYCPNCGLHFKVEAGQ